MLVGIPHSPREGCIFSPQSLDPEDGLTSHPQILPQLLVENRSLQPGYLGFWLRVLGTRYWHLHFCGKVVSNLWRQEGSKYLPTKVETLAACLKSPPFA